MPAGGRLVGRAVEGAGRRAWVGRGAIRSQSNCTDLIVGRNKRQMAKYIKMQEIQDQLAWPRPETGGGGGTAKERPRPLPWIHAPGLKGKEEPSTAHFARIVPPRVPYLPPLLSARLKKTRPFRFSFPRFLHTTRHGKPPSPPSPPRFRAFSGPPGKRGPFKRFRFFARCP